jgi:hypothetical protein
VFYHLVEVTFNLLHPCILPDVQFYCISVSLLVSHEKCPIWQVLLIIKFGTFAFFFGWYHILFKFIMFDSKCPKCHTRFFILSNTSCINRLKSFSCQVSHFFSYCTKSLIIVLFRLRMFVMSYHFFLIV